MNLRKSFQLKDILSSSLVPQQQLSSFLLNCSSGNLRRNPLMKATSTLNQSTGTITDLHEARFRNRSSQNRANSQNANCVAGIQTPQQNCLSNLYRTNSERSTSRAANEALEDKISELDSIVASSKTKFHSLRSSQTLTGVAAAAAAANFPSFEPIPEVIGKQAVVPSGKRKFSHLFYT